MRRCLACQSTLPLSWSHRLATRVQWTGEPQVFVHAHVCGCAVNGVEAERQRERERERERERGAVWPLESLAPELVMQAGHTRAVDW